MTGRPTSPESAQRAQAMFDRWEAGESLREIGDSYGMSKGSILHRLARAGLYTPVARGSHARIVAEKMAMPRVERDPCTWCGTRGDIDCPHRRPA